MWDEKGLFSPGPDFYATQPCVPDMHQGNETGKWAGRFLYRTHEVRSALDLDGDGVKEGPHGALSVTDLETGATKLLLERADWEALDGIKWTPWGTLLFAEEVITAAFKDPAVPQAQCGLLYEIALDPQDPSTALSVTARPAVGSVSHEGIAIDSAGDLYVIDEFASGILYPSPPDRRGDLSSGRIHRRGRVGFDSPPTTLEPRRDHRRAHGAAAGSRSPHPSQGGRPRRRPGGQRHALRPSRGSRDRRRRPHAAVTSENLVLSIDLKARPAS